MSTPAAPQSQRPSPIVSPLVYPLDDFYSQSGLRLPEIHPVDGENVPEPYKTLLVHSSDMTPTLESFYGKRVHLEVLQRQQRDDFYYRQVLLLLDGSNAPVEFGAIKINLALFPPAARREVLSEKTPLGRVLHEHQIPHHSRPKAFLRVEADAFIASVFKIPIPAHSLYGRRNTLVDPMQRPIAEIVEILPPAAKASHSVPG